MDMVVEKESKIEQAHELIVKQVGEFAKKQSHNDTLSEKVEAIAREVIKSDTIKDNIFVSEGGNILIGKRGYEEFAEQLAGKLHEQGVMIVKSDDDGRKVEELMGKLAEQLDQHEKIEILGVREPINLDRLVLPELPGLPAPARPPSVPAPQRGELLVPQPTPLIPPGTCKYFPKTTCSI